MFERPAKTPAINTDAYDLDESETDDDPPTPPPDTSCTAPALRHEPCDEAPWMAADQANEVGPSEESEESDEEIAVPMGHPEEVHAAATALRLHSPHKPTRDSDPCGLIPPHRHRLAAPGSPRHRWPRSPRVGSRGPRPGWGR